MVSFNIIINELNKIMNLINSQKNNNLINAWLLYCVYIYIITR